MAAFSSGLTALNETGIHSLYLSKAVHVLLLIYRIMKSPDILTTFAHKKIEDIFNNLIKTLLSDLN